MAEIIPPRSSSDRDPREKAQEEKIHSGESQRKHSISPTLLDSNGIGFQMRPNLHEKFNHGKVESIIEAVIREFMIGKHYSTEEETDKWCGELACLIKSKVKELNFPRYKLVTMVTMGEQIGGGIHIGMKCLWDADTDVYANFSYTTDKMFVIGTVCGVFYY